MNVGQETLSFAFVKFLENVASVFWPRCPGDMKSVALASAEEETTPEVSVWMNRSR